MSRLIACAVVRDDPPQVFVAEDLETLNWVLALQLVAATPGRSLTKTVRNALRAALLDERWGDAVELWILHADVAVDVYASTDLFGPADVELAPAELQFRPLFED
jgi:plasmid stability protein